MSTLADRIVARAVTGAMPLTDDRFKSLLKVISTNAAAIEKQIDRVGGLEEASKRGGIDTIVGQLHEINTAVNTLVRRLGK